MRTPMNKEKALKLFEPFENILFDYGGIFLDLDFNRTVQEFAKLNATIDFNEFFSKQRQTPLFNFLETGKITPAEFIFELKKLLSLPQAEDSMIIRAWCAMLLDIRGERVEFLRELKKTKKIYMLSNINQIHEDHLKDYLLKHPLLSDFYSLFDRVYFSHNIGIRKPDREVFEYVCSDSALDLEKTIFIDDSIQHIESAARFGLNTHFLNPPNSFICG